MKIATKLVSTATATAVVLAMGAGLCAPSGLSSSIQEVVPVAKVLTLQTAEARTASPSALDPDWSRKQWQEIADGTNQLVRNVKRVYEWYFSAVTKVKKPKVGVLKWIKGAGTSVFKIYVKKYVKSKKSADNYLKKVKVRV